VGSGRTEFGNRVNFEIETQHFQKMKNLEKIMCKKTGTNSNVNVEEFFQKQKSLFG
jgi:hypothetical protein